MYYDANGADYISTPSFAIPNTGILTIEAWMKSTFSATLGQSIVGDGGGSGAIGFIFLFRYANTNTLDSQYSDGAT